MRTAGPGRGATQRLIDGLVDAGVILKEPRGNQSSIRVNIQHPLYPELRSIVMKSFGLAEVIKEAFEPIAHLVRTAFIFGSVAQDTDRPDSDIDLMVVGDVDIFELNVIVEKAENALGRQIHLNAYNPDEWLSLSEDPVIKAIEEGDRITVICDGLENEPSEPQAHRPA